MTDELFKKGDNLVHVPTGRRCICLNTVEHEGVVYILARLRSRKEPTQFIRYIQEEFKPDNDNRNNKDV